MATRNLRLLTHPELSCHKRRTQPDLAQMAKACRRLMGRATAAGWRSRPRRGSWPRACRTRHAELVADVGDVLALAQHPIGLRQLAHDLLRRMPLPRCHVLVEPSCP